MTNALVKVNVESDYLVVFEKTDDAGDEAGIITWSSFKSKAAFDEWWASDDIAHVRAVERILKEGVTEEQAVALTQTTPRESYVRAAIGNATMSDGIIDEELLRYEAMNLAVLGII